MFLYDGDNVVADYTGGALAALYVTPFLDQNLSLTKNGAIYYYSHDGLGSVRTLSDLSSVAVNRYDYTAWGEPLAPAARATLEQRYAFTGRERNTVSVSFYFRYRIYFPSEGRFVTRDPLKGPTGLSLYSYVMNMPTGRVDPSGLLEDIGGVLPLSPPSVRPPMVSDALPRFLELVPSKEDVREFEKALEQLLLLPCCYEVIVRINTTNSILNATIHNCNEILWIGHGERPSEDLPISLGTADFMVPSSPEINWSQATQGSPNVFVASCYGYDIAAELFVRYGLIAIGPIESQGKAIKQHQLVQYATGVLEWYRRKCEREGPFDPPKRVCILIGPR